MTVTNTNIILQPVDCFVKLVNLTSGKILSSVYFKQRFYVWIGLSGMTIKRKRLVVALDAASLKNQICLLRRCQWLPASTLEHLHHPV